MFSTLAGTGYGATTHYGALHDAINGSPDGTGETPLFGFRAHKNGTLHLRFLRADLLARFNQIVGGAALRPTEDAQ